MPVIVVLAGVALLISLSQPSPDGKGGAWLLFWGAAAGWAVAQAVFIFVARDIGFYLPDAVAGAGHGVLDVGRVIEFIVRLAAYGALAFTVSRMQRGEVNAVVVAVVVSAAFQSLYGLVNHAAGNPSILGAWPRGMHVDSVMGTFYSRNQLAGYLAVALPIGLAWLWSRYRHAAPRSGARALMLGLAVIYAALLAVALIGSGSRLGVVSAVAGLALWAVLAARRRPDMASVAATRVVVWTLVALAIGAVLWFGPDVIITRFLQLSRDDARFAIWATMLDMPWRAWLWGIGPGQFVDVFKLFQGPELPQTFWRALNDYLQFVLEYGLVGSAAMMVVLAWWLRRTWPAALDTLQRAALAGVVAILVHGLGDFDLRVPGTAVLFWVSNGLILRGVRRAPSRSRA